MPAKQARPFGDELGVNIRLTLTSGSYGDFNTVESRLRELGVRYVNDSLCPTCGYQIDHLNRLAADGIHTTLGVGNQNDSAYMHQNLQVIKSDLLGAVIGVVGANEPDISGDAQWIAHTRAFQADLYNRVKSDPALAHLIVIGPSLVNQQSRSALGDLTAYLDRGNIHPYPGGNLPMLNLALEHQLAANVSGQKPLVATETGYHDDLTFMGAHRGASQRAKAIYTPRLILEGFRDGLDRTYLFQLADAWSPAQVQAWNLDPTHNEFGLLRWDLSPKPAFNALRNLMRTVDADSQPVASPGGLRYGLEGAGPDVRQLLLRSADGSYALVLWRQVSVWNQSALQDVYPPPDHLTVALGQQLGLVQRFDPVSSDAESARWTDPTRIPVDLEGAPVVLRLAPPGVAAAHPGATGGDVGGRAVALSRTKKRQRLARHVVIKVSCHSPCVRVVAKGKLAVKRRHARRRKLYPLRSARKRVHHGVVTLRLKVPARSRRAALRALARGGRVTALVSVTGYSAKRVKLGRVAKRVVVMARG